MIALAEPVQNAMDMDDSHATAPEKHGGIKLKIAVVLPKRAEAQGSEPQNSTYWILDIPMWCFNPLPRWFSVDEIHSGTWFPFLRMAPPAGTRGEATTVSMHENVSLDGCERSRSEYNYGQVYLAYCLDQAGHEVLMVSEVQWIEWVLHREASLQSAPEVKAFLEKSDLVVARGAPVVFKDLTT